MGATDPVEQSIIFFDGVCNLCNHSVQFIIKRDKKGQFQFASLQSAKAVELLPEEFIQGDNFQSIVLLKGDRHYKKSTAALMVAKKLSGLWPALYVFIIIPAFIRDVFYDIIAKNRYLLFGKKDQCMIPSPEMKHRFID